MMDIEVRDLSAGDAKSTKKLTDMIREFKNELKKVSWTTKEELKFFTIVVVGTIFTFGLGIYFVDLAIKGFLHMIGRIVH